MPQIKIIAGDTLGAIAEYIDSTVAELLSLNPAVKDKNKIYVGQVINLPDTFTARQYAAGRANALAVSVGVQTRTTAGGAYSPNDFPPLNRPTEVVITGGGATSPLIFSNPWILGGLAVIAIALLMGNKK